MHIRAGLTFCVLCALALGSGTPRAHADLTADELRAARRQLHEYDLHGGTARVLARLTRFIGQAEGANLREARFLRAAVATDLVILGMSGSAPQVRGDIAQAVGVSESELMAWLDGELERVSFGVYQPVAEESRWALRVIEDGDIDPHVLHDGEGERRDMLYVNAVVDALGRDDDIARLAEFGEDPCADAAVPCGFSMFAPQGRRAADALREAANALARLERLAQTNEPLVASMAGLVAADGVVLRTAEIFPIPAFDSGLGVHGVGARGEPAHPELLVILEPGVVRYAYVPAVRVMGRDVRVVAGRSPALPSWASFQIQPDNRTAVIPWDDVTTHFRAMQERESHGTVGLAITAGVTGLSMSRMLVSMQSAGLPTPLLISRGLEDEARAVHIRVIGEEDFRAPTTLYVRLGGYSLRRNGHLMDVPRVRAEDGLQFDLARLAQVSEEGAEQPASLRYMSSIEWPHVLDAAFHMRPRAGSELNLQIR